MEVAEGAAVALEDDESVAAELVVTTAASLTLSSTPTRDEVVVESKVVVESSESRHVTSLKSQTPCKDGSAPRSASQLCRQSSPCWCPCRYLRSHLTQL